MFQKPSELRENRRRVLRGEVRAILADGSRLQGQVLDVSVGGIGLILPCNLPAGSELRIWFLVPDKMRGRVPVEALARVAHAVFSSKQGAFQVGLIFKQIPEEQRLVLERYVLE